MGNNYAGGLFKVVIFILIAMAVVLGLPQLNTVLFPVVGEPSATYDCDDAALDMYRHFEQLGIESTPVVGNLEMTGETYIQSNHVWLLVKSGDKLIAYDWGKPRFDKQHFEGYKIELDYLLYVVQQDKKSPDLVGIAEN
jgi:hypothetical protein